MENDYLIAFGYYGSVFLLGVVFMYAYHLHKKEEAMNNRTTQVQHTAITIVERAEKKAEIIVEDAVKEIGDIMKETNVFHEDIEKQVKEALYKSVSTYLQSIETEVAGVHSMYEKMAEETKAQYLKESSETLNKIKEIGQEEVQSYESSLKSNAATSQQYIKEKIDLEFENTKKEIEAYKLEEMKRVNDTISSVMLKIIERIVGKSLSTAEHEKLIFEALEQAKKENLFKM